MTPRRLNLGDVPAAFELSALAGWNQTADDWRGYLEFEPAGCFGIEREGRLAGTATTLRYGDRLGWIGMVLVHPAHRRQGVGTELLRHAIDYLRQAGTESIKLDATAAGEKVYRPLGFEAEYEVIRYEGAGAVDEAAVGVGRVIRGAPGLQTPRITRGVGRGVGKPDALQLEAEVGALDAEAFGADRRRVLEALAGRATTQSFVAETGGRVSGYLIARPGREALQVGPWVARDGVSAENLLRAFLAGAVGARVFVDVPLPNAAGVELMQRCGFSIQRKFLRMYLGAKPAPGIAGSIFGTGGAEKG